LGSFKKTITSPWYLKLVANLLDADKILEEPCIAWF